MHPLIATTAPLAWYLLVHPINNHSICATTTVTHTTTICTVYRKLNVPYFVENNILVRESFFTIVADLAQQLQLLDNHQYIKLLITLYYYSPNLSS